MTNKQKYLDLVKELEALEKSLHPEHGFTHLSDVCVDLENVDPSLEVESEEYYACLIACAENAAGSRASEFGLNINKLLGRVIY